MYRRITCTIPAALLEDITALARQRSLNLSAVVEQALNLWKGCTPDQIAHMAGPLLNLSAANRKQVVNFIEVLNGPSDIRAYAVKRLKALHAVIHDRGEAHIT